MAVSPIPSPPIFSSHLLHKPERIKGESQNNLGTYTVSSDVWSLGLSMIEIGLGKYPYPPETYSNVFAQLTAIVHGDPPELPEEHYSETARDWVNLCLRKDPQKRPTYHELLARILFKITLLILHNKLYRRTTTFSSKTAIAMLTWSPGCKRP